MIRALLTNLLLLPSVAIAIECDLSITPAQNAARQGSAPGTALFCELAQARISKNLAYAVDQFESVVSITSDQTWNRYAKTAGVTKTFPAYQKWHLIQIKDQYLVFYRPDIPEQFQYSLLINKTSVKSDIEIRRGMSLAAISPFLALRYEGAGKDFMGFDRKVRLYSPVYPIQKSDVSSIISTVEKTEKIKINHYSIHTNPDRF